MSQPERLAEYVRLAKELEARDTLTDNEWSRLNELRFGISCILGPLLSAKEIALRDKWNLTKHRSV